MRDWQCFGEMRLGFYRYPSCIKTLRFFLTPLNDNTFKCNNKANLLFRGLCLSRSCVGGLTEHCIGCRRSPDCYFHTTPVGIGWWCMEHRCWSIIQCNNGFCCTVSHWQLDRTATAYTWWSPIQALSKLNPA